jgi:hypothetical protein
MSINISFVVVDLKRFGAVEAKELLTGQGIFSKVVGNDLQVLSFQVSSAQQQIDRLAEQMPDLLPVQFHFMLNKYGFDGAIASLLPALKTEDLDKYAMYKAYLEQARFYEFEKTLVMFTEIQDKFAAVDESLNFTLEQLKSMWIEASRV